MSLSESDRDMVASFIKKKGVTRCPDATYTPLPEIRFKDKSKNVPADKTVEKRNKLIDRLYSEGLTQRQVCEALCLNQSIVSTRFQWLKYKDTLATRSGIS